MPWAIAIQSHRQTIGCVDGGITKSLRKILHRINYYFNNIFSSCAECLGRSLGPFLNAPKLFERLCSHDSLDPAVVSSPFTSEDTTTPWSWEAPDLGRNRAWYRPQVQGLNRAVRTYPPDRHAAMLAEGQGHQDIHRRNHGPKGPQCLQLLCWEFPHEHWDAVYGMETI